MSIKTMVRDTSRWRWSSAALLLAVAACDDGGGGSSVSCGEGTTEQDGKCVASADGDGSDGDGTDGDGTDGDGTDGDDGDGTTPTACGEGTILSGDECIVDPDTTLECGDGTVATDGKCTVAPPPPPTVEDLLVTHLALKTRGALLTDGAVINQFYPVELSVGITYTGDAAKIPVVFALGEPPDPNIPEDEEQDLGFCLVGGFDVEHPGGATPTESIASGTLYIPKGCLKDGATSLTASPLLLIDPDRTVGAEDQDSVTRRVAFMKQNDVDEDMTACRADSSEMGEKGTCQIEVEIQKSQGLDFDLAKLTVESSVVVLDKCADDWQSIEDGTANVDDDRPPSYRCNKSIVPDFERDEDGDIVLDNDGNPIQKTYKDDLNNDLPRFVYGAADLALDVTLITHGADDSVIDTGEEAEALDADADEDAVNNVLEENGLQIQYTIRPADSTAEADWRNLYLHKEGEQAKAGEEGESGQDPAQFEETEAVPATPHYYSHGLYVENDCGERNKDTCDATHNPRTDIIYGDWADQTDFVVRACLVPVDLAGDVDTSIDEDDSNNCRDIPIKIVRHDTSGASNAASSYRADMNWGDGVGDQNTLRMSWGFHSWNGVDLNGAGTDNEAALTIGSNLVGYTDILKGWAKGAAYVAVVGSYYDYGISTFGIELWGDAKTIPEFHWSQNWSVTKELRKGTTLWAGCIPVSLEIRFAGIAGVSVALDIIAAGAGTSNPVDSGPEQALLTKASTAAKIGLATLNVTPYGNMTVTAAASVSALVVRVGVAGELTLLDMTIPFSGTLWWGLTNLSPFTLAMGTWADVKMTFTTMRGRVYLFAENYTINWCSKRVNFGWWSSTVSYPCGDSWNTFWDFTIASWGGWTWNQTLWSSPYLATELKL